MYTTDFTLPRSVNPRGTQSHLAFAPGSQRPPPCASPRSSVAFARARPALAGFLTAALSLTFAASPVRADTLDGILDRLDPETSGMAGCIPAANSDAASGQTASQLANCVANQALSGVLDETFRLMGEHGRVVFGPNFRIESRLSLSTTGSGLSGDIDSVIPFHSLAAEPWDGSGLRRSFFLQNGLTRWTDEHGTRRNDTRIGVVHRFTVSAQPDADMLGASAFIQQNLERGHQRLATSLDYAGWWGSGSLNYYAPTTDWRPGRSGFEERALEGMELRLGLSPTSTIDVTGAIGRWEGEDEFSRWSTRGRVTVGWRPHPWLKLATDWNGIGSTDEDAGVRMAIAIPFGGGGQKPRWEGLGLTGDNVVVDTPSLWQSADIGGRIEFAERQVSGTTDTVDNVIDGAEIQFLQDSADTGGQIVVQVTLPGPVSEDTRVYVRLMPGDGDNPAVPGEDYVDEAIEVLIASGQSTGTATIELLHNPDMTEVRSLSAVVVSA